MAIGDPPPLNVQPIGLLNFLGIKSGGRYPMTLDGTLLPTLELFEHYVAANSEEYFATPAAFGTTAAGGVEFTSTGPSDIIAGAGALTVPTSEYWYVQYMALRMNFNAAAGESASMCPGVRLANSSNGLATTLSGYETSVAARARSFCRTVQDPFWLRPGSGIFILVHEAVTAATLQPVLGFRIARFRA